MEINVELAKKLITEQFPQWEELPISAVSHSGWDNRTFHLGQEMVIRLPSAEKYAPQILKECLWLPKLARQISFKIPKPLGLGYPSETYPWHWSINTWIDGKSLNQDTNVDLKQLAKDLAQFLKEFESLDTTDGPVLEHGNQLRDYTHEINNVLAKMKSSKERTIANSIWNKALNTNWNQKPIWVHGDLAIGNILIENAKLEGIIDFSGLEVGDPACDLVIAWNLFDAESRAIFKKNMNLDKNTWIRAMGWCLWKTLCWPVKGTPVERILNNLYEDYDKKND